MVRWNASQVGWIYFSHLSGEQPIKKRREWSFQNWWATCEIGISIFPTKKKKEMQIHHNIFFVFQWKPLITWSSAEPRARATSASCMLSSEGKPACKSWYFDCCSSVMRSTLWRLLMTSPCAVWKNKTSHDLLFCQWTLFQWILALWLWEYCKNVYLWYFCVLAARSRNSW